MSRFVGVDRDSAYLLPPAVDEWLPQDHLARFVVGIIDQMGLRELMRQYEGRSSGAYHPTMMLGRLLSGCATGMHSNRKIEAQFRHEVQLLLKLAEDCDSRAVDDGMDVPTAIARREKRLAAVDTGSMLATAHVTQPANEKRGSRPIPVLDHFAAGTPVPGSNDPALRMAHRLNTKKGRLLHVLRAAHRGRPMPTTTLNIWSYTGPGTLRRGYRRVERSDSASQRCERRHAAGTSATRGSSATVA